MKVLVCGGAGFIGSHVIDSLIRDGNSVICVDSLDPGVHHFVPDYLRKEAEYCVADLRYWQPDARCDDVEAVVHLAALGGVARAAREPANIVAANAWGTARLIEAALGWKKLERFILISSFSVYGTGYAYACRQCGNRQSGAREAAALTAGRYEVTCARCGGECEVEPITPATSPNPLEIYGASKYMQELCCRSIDPAVLAILRLSSVYGQRLRLDDGESTIIAKMAGWIRSGVTPRLFEDGRQLRDWVYVGDVVGAVLALLHGSGDPVTNVCSGVGTSLLDACAILSNVIGVDCLPEVVGGYREGDMRHCVGDPAPLSQLLGRAPKPFREGARLAFKALEMAHSYHRP